jgi:hypothetical protein
VLVERSPLVYPPPLTHAPAGRMAPLTDPFGAVFWLVDTSATQQPDRAG